MIGQTSPSGETNAPDPFGNLTEARCTRCSQASERSTPRARLIAALGTRLNG